MRNRLLPGEQLILRTRPQPRRLIVPVAAGLLVVAVAAMMLAWLQPGPFGRLAPNAAAVRQPAVVLVLAGAILLLVAYPVRRFLAWHSTRYLLTNRRILVWRGWPVRRSLDVPLSTLNVLDVRQKLVQRPFRCGDMVVVANGSRCVLADIPEIDRFHQFAHEALGAAVRDTFGELPESSGYAGNRNSTGREPYRREAGTFGGDY